MNDTDLLDFYAGLALAGVVSKYSTDYGLKGSSEKCAQIAFRYATAMLDERKKHVKERDE